MDERATIARLHRRLGFGLSGDALDAAAGRGTATALAELVDPDRAGVPQTADPFAGLDLTYEKGQVAEQAVAMVAGWIDLMVASTRPLEDWTAWFWHGHFVSSIEKVRRPALMADQVRLFQAKGMGAFPELVRAVTIDAAMLWYLDGRTSTGAKPNENFGRELLELFTLGRGHYTEADVQAGARALTGYHLSKNDTGDPQLVARAHDDRPQHYLGLEGVHDVDTVVRAVTGHPACAMHVAAKLARAVLGPAVDDDHVTAATAAFRGSGLSVRALAGALGQMLIDGVDGGPVVLAPVPWLVACLRATGARLEPKVLARGLRAAGQLPLAPPNVAGWPSGEAWFASATIVARFDLAAAVAVATPAGNPCRDAAERGDADALAHTLGLPGPFSSSTAHAVGSVDDPLSRLVVALTSSDVVLA